ncbi:CGNR zinc finger domain-containing protein [Microbispora sp. H10949]|nr:CGNR zinc finger domain-containing protein [Microbispora sp. H10949]
MMSYREPLEETRLLESFANTIDVERGADLLESVEGMRAWLAAQGLPAHVTPHDLARARTLRQGLRARLLADGEQPDRRSMAAAHAVLDGLALRSDDPLAAIARAWLATTAGGEWPRLKRCPDRRCGWVFWDGSRDGTRTRCSRPPAASPGASPGPSGSAVLTVLRGRP